MLSDNQIWGEFHEWLDKRLPYIETPRFSTMEPKVYRATEYLNAKDVDVNAIFKAWVIDFYGEATFKLYEMGELS